MKNERKLILMYNLIDVQPFTTAEHFSRPETEEPGGTDASRPLYGKCTIYKW